MSIIQENAVVLFQGDSVTDCGRSREKDQNMGDGYAGMTAAMFSAMYPEKKVTFKNRGISGNRVIDLKERWEEDCILLKPSFVSILIGVNDCWRKYDNNDPTTPEKFEENYRYILDEIRNKLENTNIVLCEPFLLPVSEERRKWREDLDPKIHVVRKLAQEFGTYFIPLDGLFAQACTKRPPEFWSPDGVHPSYAGHALIAGHLLKILKGQEE